MSIYKARCQHALKTTIGTKVFYFQNEDFYDLSHLSNAPGPAIMRSNK